ncbi:MAG TPA: phosphate ABC transporter ATP-binding protein [Bryobacteraceae bacterium]|nr:phosphate ABC transporter ATP-binding protein [Bryobacteraceae bacterium]
MPILETVHLTREAGGKKLVEDISVAVERAEVLAVAGPSGAGKSCLLRLLNRLDEPTSGTVYLEGKDYRALAPRELRRRVGMMTQMPYLFPGTVTENLRFGPRQQGKHLSGAEVDALLERVGLRQRAAHPVEHLSGGEAQRVSLARALANRPCVLLLDEPTSALDEGSKQEVETLILDVVRQNALTCIVVTHDMAQAARMADRVLLLKAGRLARIGGTREVLHAEGNLS